MEGLIILAVLAMIGGVIILPIAAFVRSGQAIRKAEHLQHKLASLESDLRRLKRQFGSPAPAPPEDTLEPLVVAVPHAPATTIPPDPLTDVLPEQEAVAQTPAAGAAEPVAGPGLATAYPPPLPPF